MDEKELIRKAKNGDTMALSKLLQQNYSFLVKYLMKVTLHPQIRRRFNTRDDDEVC